MTAGKVPLFAGLDSLADAAPARKPVNREQVNELAAASDFPSRGPVATQQSTGGGKLSATSLVRQRRRYTTGRGLALGQGLRRLETRCTCFIYCIYPVECRYP